MPCSAAMVERPFDRRAAVLRRATVVVVALAALVRLAATWNDLWFDEIWTLSLIGGLRSPLGILTELHHDNNHPLNSFLLYLLRPLGSDWAYRLPAWGAGVATLVLGAYVNTLDDGAHGDAAPSLRGLFAALVLGASHPLVHYGSEARGYALALAFGLAAIAVALRDGVRPGSRAAPLAWTALLLALLAHALAVHFLAALVAWSIVRTLRRGDGWRRTLVTIGWWYAVPMLGTVALYLGFLHDITIGGGPREGLLAPLLRAIAVTTALPLHAPAVLLLAVAPGLLAGGLVWLALRGSDLWALYLVGAVISPAALAVLAPTDLYAERYLLVSSLLWLLLLARLLAWATTRGTVMRALAFAATVAFVAGNAERIGSLLRDGRGQYVAALRYIASHSSGPTALVTSDHDFRNRLVIEYYAPRIEGLSIRYLMRAECAETIPEWYVAHRGPEEEPPPDVLPSARGIRCRVVAQYPATSLSGWRWFLCHREDASGTGS